MCVRCSSSGSEFRVQYPVLGNTVPTAGTVEYCTQMVHMPAPAPVPLLYPSATATSRGQAL